MVGRLDILIMIIYGNIYKEYLRLIKLRIINFGKNWW